ncbi:right-handed parallel beta-helix repeat-containing protein [Mucilaginibacter sp. RS28]|uniref:Right-handed parallel beta-helix repeat-containing protein n=1 Tax=Mucilaginibacter straminoryzae TaxID=2932774 RepID=A0A9X2B7V4_9SPHI|nr:right-handed parallel beta-helix repeat-containing protein [Mucilaginibacter straminoryzae]MCJ8208994.1 right-handed parallel beta-helix repeat-containing protein [Mucilaginibacter straminoryzae]
MKRILIISALGISLVACKKQLVNTTPVDDVSKSHKTSVNTIGKIYYVDSTGSDTNDGLSTLTPWKSIDKVNSITFSPGDQILFKCGNSWSGQLHPRGSGASGTPIVIDQYGTGNKPVIRGPGTKSSAGVLLYNQSYWEINNLEVTNYYSGGDTLLRGIFVTNTNLTTKANYIHINNCYVHDVNAYGYAASPTLYSKLTGGIILYGYFDDLQVRKCHVANCTVEGLRTLPYPSGTGLSTNVKFISNTIENIYGDGIVLSTVSAGLIDSNVVKNACMSNDQDYAGCWTYHSQNSIISHNEVYNLAGGRGDGEAFDADENTDGDIYEYNYTHDNANGFMEFMPSAANIIVRYNVSVNDCKAGVRLFNYLPSTTSNSLYNNVWYITNNMSKLIDCYSAAGFNGTLKNNILFCTGTVTKFCKSSAGTSSTCLNNCFYPGSITSVNGPVGTVSGNITTNPSFVNAGFHSVGLSSGTAYKLNSGSPCLSAGVLVSGNGGYDYSHNLLTTGNPDMGAFQN